jgi:hypothetical protein
LLEASGEGHCGLPTAELLQLGQESCWRWSAPIKPAPQNGCPCDTAEIQAALDQELAASQRAAVQLALASKVLVITGGRGSARPP